MMLPPQLAAPLAVARALPWRLIGIVAAGLALVLLTWRAMVWRDGYEQVEEMKSKLAVAQTELAAQTEATTAAAIAYAEAVHKAQATAEQERKATEEIDREYRTRIAAADSTARGLAERLRDYQARRCSGPVPAAADPAPGGAPPGGEPGDGAEVDRRTAGHLAACARDAEALNGWNDWWDGVERRAEQF